MSQWYAIRVVSRQEAFVVGALEEAGLFGYAPKHVTEAKFARRKAVRTRPLIPGYVFASLPDDDAIQAALAIQGVIRSAHRIPLRGIDIGALVLEEACHAYDETWTPPKPKGLRYHRRWKPGDIATLDARDMGLLAGHSVKILRTKNRDRLDVLLTICGRTSEIEVRDHQLTQPIACSLAA